MVIVLVDQVTNWVGRGQNWVNVLFNDPPNIDFQNFSEKMTIPISVTCKNLLQTVIRLKKVSLDGLNEILIIFVNFSRPICNTKIKSHL